MVGATASDNTATTTTPVTFNCSTCGFSTNDRTSQRTHFKSDWHITNLKRKIDSLPPLPWLDTPDGVESDPAHLLQVVHKSSQQSIPIPHQDGDQKHEDVTIRAKQFHPSICLFCAQQNANLNENLEHMQSHHGFVIPCQADLIDLESFLGYLFALVFEFYECLFCRTSSASSRGTQQHMIARGHCKLGELTGDSDYLEFYELSDRQVESPDVNTAPSPENKRLLEDSIDVVHLPSGRTLSHRSALLPNRPRRSPHRSNENLHNRQEIRNADLEEANSLNATTIQSSDSHQMTIRRGDDQGLIGVAEWQRRALRATEKKLVRDELRARNRFRAGLEKKNNNQKNFCYDVPFPGDHNVRY